MRKRIIIIAIIIFSIIMVGILAVSPILIDSRLKSDSQWIPFYASYLGGIFGGIVSGSLTLGGVYLTIRHQNKLLSQEKIAKVSYVCRKLGPEFRKLDKLIKNEDQSDVGLQIYNIEQHAERFLEIIDHNKKYIMETDFHFINYIESVIELLERITNYDHSNWEQAIKDLERTNVFVQSMYAVIQLYENKFQ